MLDIAKQAYYYKHVVN